MLLLAHPGTFFARRPPPGLLRPSCCVIPTAVALRLQAAGRSARLSNGSVRRSAEAMKAALRSRTSAIQAAASAEISDLQVRPVGFHSRGQGWGRDATKRGSHSDPPL